jgi:hypothetical protein
MFRRILLVLLACLVPMSFIRADEPKKDAVFPKFEMQEIATDLGVGYAVLLVDVNGDGKKDIVVVDQKRVVWYENPTWKRRIIIENQTKPDNVCIAAYDIDGDGQIDFALGAGWGKLDTKEGGTIQWLKRGKTLDEKWTVYPIGEEPTVHRMRFVKLDGKPHLVVVPLMGRDSTQKANWVDGKPVRILAYKIPTDPTKDRWIPEFINQSLHVVHNFDTLPEGGHWIDNSMITASYEGISFLSKKNNKWEVRLQDKADQSNPRGNRGASEIKVGKLQNTSDLLATIEPWHGDQVVIYVAPVDPDKDFERRVLDKELKWGHAVWFADLDGDKNDELIIGVRDDKSDKPGERRGVRLYKALDDEGTKWARQILDDGGIAVEDLAAADLDGDGRIDIVAVGRQTHNIRIYWNRGTK